MQINSSTTLLILMAFVISLTVYTVPINSTMDVYIDYSIEKPFLGEVNIKNLNAVAHAHTLMTSPLSGAFFGLDLGFAEPVIESGTISVYVKAGDVEKEKVIGNIIRTTSISGTLILAEVPKDQKEITVSIYEDGQLKETQKVVLR